MSSSVRSVQTCLNGMLAAESYLHVGILDQESEEGHRAADQEHPDDAVKPIFAIHPVSDPMDGGLLWNSGFN